MKKENPGNTVFGIFFLLRKEERLCGIFNNFFSSNCFLKRLLFSLFLSLYLQKN